MPLKPVKQVPIELDRLRTFRYDFNALAAFEGLYGKSIAELFAPKYDEKGELMPVAVSMGELRDMVWAGLIHEDEALTPKDVGSWLSPDNIGDVAPIMMEALGQSNAQVFPQSPESGTPKKSRSCAK